MRIESLKAHGFASLVDVDLNIREIDPGLVALTGPNGAGKTCLLELAPAAIYRQLPSRDGGNPVDYATQRDSFVEIQYTLDDGDAYRIRLSLDGAKRKSDGVLEQILGDGTHTPLNDGKISTLDAAIAARFPSLDVFVNSAFAAQGRGDEFTRRKPSQRKDLFTEFLGLRQLLAMAKTAADAADLARDARLRLTVRQEALARDAGDAQADELDRLAKQLQITGGEAEVRQRELKAEIADLETRLALVADQAAAYAAAQQKVRAIEDTLATRRAEHQQSAQARVRAAGEAGTELAAIDQRRDTTLQDIATRIAGNHQLRDQGSSIRAAVAAIATIDGQLVEARERERELQARRAQLSTDLSRADAAVHAFTSPQLQLTRARADAQLLGAVPCGGAGEYAACQFLVNATAAAARIAELEATVAGMTAAVEQAARIKTALATVDGQLASARTVSTRLETDRKGHEAKAKYEKALIDAEARLAELEQKQRDVHDDHARQTEAAHARHALRAREFDDRDHALTEAIQRLEPTLDAARAELDLAATGNSQAQALQAALALERGRWDQVTGTISRVASGHEDLARRRHELAAKRAALVDVGRRLAHIEQELVEWQDLAKALGKGGLPDLEIDAAGPTISALCNQLLLACYGPRFSIELVTQVQKSDGSGVKDLFTVVVTDNEHGGAGRDIANLSGGEKTIVQEALMSAISIYVNERSSMPMRTLFRDETGAALDPENAVHYVNMLRKVRELGGFCHVLYVSHNPIASAMADAQIQVADGQARIVRAPFSEAAA